MTSIESNVEIALAWLSTAPISALRKRWRGVFKSEPPKAFGPDLLRRSIAYRIQEQAYGGLSKQTQQLLNGLVKALEAKPQSPLKVQRRMQPGSEIVRTWKGADHRVRVLGDGFTYNGKRYSSLSEVAAKITGTKWNGPRFFGLRPKPTPSANARG